MRYLFFGNLIAQLISLCTLLIFVSLFSSEAFGFLAVTTSIASILSPVASLKYDQAIYAKKSGMSAYRLVQGVTGFSIILGIISFISVSIITYCEILKVPTHFYPLIFALPFFFVAQGMLQTGFSLFNSMRQYRKIFIARVIQPTIYLLAALGLYLLNIFPGKEIVYGFVVSVILSGYLYLIFVWKNLPSLNLHRSFLNMKKSWQLAKYKFLTAFTESATSQLPIFFFASNGDVAFAGLFFLAQRLLRFPNQLVGVIVKDYLRGEARSVMQLPCGLRNQVMIAFFLLVCVSIVASFSIIVLDFVDIITLVDGSYDRLFSVIYLMLPVMILQLITTPFSSLLVVFGEVKIDFFLHFVLLGGLYIIATINSLSSSDFLVMYSIIFCVKYLAEFYFSVRFLVKNGWVI